MWRRAAVVVVTMGAAVPAAAQGSWDGRGMVSVNGGYQASSTDFRDSLAITVFAEDGTIDTGYEVESAPAFDVHGGVRLWRALGVGVGVSRFSASSPAPVTARIPHPFFFDQHREISGQAETEREEVAVHLDALFVAGSERFLVALFGGPTFFNVKQELVSNVEYQEAFPFDEAVFQRAVVTRESESKTGFNVGADVSFLFTRNVGVGGIVRFSRATVDLATADGDELSVDVGGVQVGGGLRLFF